MEYPLFEVHGLSGGMLIAIVAIVHVFIAQFAIGAGIYMAVTHTLALRRNDELLLRYLKDHGQFLVLLSFVLGALTGVGIWVTIGLVSPAATSRLIHIFVWGWAIEWCLFVVELAAGYAYYYGWGRLKPRQHVAVAWVYAVASVLTLVVINGIVTFMLTPGGWIEMIRAAEAGAAFNADVAFWRGFFNETYWPSLVMRLVSSLSLAALFVALIVNCYRSYTSEERKRIINHGAWFIAPLVLMAPVSLWYFTRLPATAQEFLRGGAVAMMLFLAFGVFASLAIGFYAYFGLLRARRYINFETSVLLLAMAFVATGSMEFVREGVRKPYLIYDYLYSNGIPATGKLPQRIAQEGLLAHARFTLPPGRTHADVQRLPLHEHGALVYHAQCRMCHEYDGYNAIRPLVANKSRELLLSQLKELDRWAYMPPFHGTEREMKALLEFLLHLYQGDDYRPPPPGYVDTPVAEILAGHSPQLVAEPYRAGQEVPR